MTRLADTGLPIESVVGEVQAGLAEGSRCVLTAEPGAGKTTVVPLRLLDEPWLNGRRIVMLEPRRLAARASAARMASLIGERVGETIGVTTRDDRRVSAQTRIEVVTEGVLTRRLQHDPSLGDTGLVIFDEFHERNQQGDLGLAFLLDACSSLELDLAILVMSATIDAEAVASLLANGATSATPVPIVHCEGRTFPIDIQWRPRNRRDRLEPAVAAAVTDALDQVVSGDVLVFLPGMAEIRRTGEQLGAPDGVDVHILHGSLPLDEQDAAVAPAAPGRRKVVLSTDIAESSLTVEGVTVVVDSGLARSPSFDVGTGLTRLTTTSISRASADQRAGRAGRLGPGTAIRLWSKIEHGTRMPFTAAEISTVDLAPLRLEAAAWGVNDPGELQLLDAPPAKAWAEAGEVLRMLGAVDRDDRLTDRGRELVRLPLHPRLASIVVAGRDRGLGRMACMVAALIDERDILGGRPGTVPTDISLRVGLLDDPGRRHPDASGRSISFVRHRADDLARRAGCDDSNIDLARVGLVVAAGFPDRVAQRRGSQRGRFRTRSGTGVRMATEDTLAGEEFIVAVDVGGPKKDQRVQRAAAVDAIDLLEAVGFDAEVSERLVWDRKRKDVFVRTDRRLGAIDLGSTDRRPKPSDEVVALLLDHVRQTNLKALPWTDAARALQARVGYARMHAPTHDWPAVDDASLRKTLDDWLAPFLVAATSRADLDILSIAVVFDSLLGRDGRVLLDRMLPSHLDLPGGRPLAIDYSADAPTVRARAQRFYGLSTHPTVLGGEVPIVVELLSPADRPIQRTSDLPGFWGGSWVEVRKDMAGRYPKHDWPVDPS